MYIQHMIITNVQCVKNYSNYKLKMLQYFFEMQCSTFLTSCYAYNEYVYCTA